MSATEINFDGLVGPTHNYGGLAQGNLASASNEGKVSNPREAALQGLSKMRALLRMGILQGALPPQERPHITCLRKMGFAGRDADVLASAARANPLLLANVSSASCMWTANAATVSPSADTGDGKVHFTPANLSSHFHRSLEVDTTTRVLSAIFAKDKHFTVHDAVPFHTFGDEGAANHCASRRLMASPGSKSSSTASPLSLRTGRAASARGRQWKPATLSPRSTSSGPAAVRCSHNSRRPPSTAAPSTTTSSRYPTVPH
jgi:succinylarginine dihydrolase